MLESKRWNSKTIFENLIDEENDWDHTVKTVAVERPEDNESTDGVVHVPKEMNIRIAPGSSNASNEFNYCEEL